MTRTVRRTQRADDDGSVLVMALIFLSIFGMLIAIVLGFAQTGFQTATSGRTISAELYAAEGAVDTVINTRRSDLTFGTEGTDVAACFSMPASVNNTAVSVRCTGRSGSGVSTGGAGGGLTPANAVLTLPTDVTEGVVQSATSSALVSGHVLTNQSRTSPAGSTLTVQGTLTCRTVTGTGTVTATTTNCPTAAPGGADPAYAAAVATRPADATVPACTAGATITFAPGTYTSAAALNALMGGACTGKTFNFTAGTYYFEFADATAALREWLINDATAAVVGGTMTASAFPNKCDLAQAGVQFMFGTDSRVRVSAGTFELCPPLSAGQRTAIYGVQTSTTGAPVSITVPATTSSSTGASPGVRFDTNPTQGAIVDNVYAAAQLCNACSALLNVTGFSATAVPANATITSANLRITHQRTTAGAGSSTARVIAADGNTVPYAVTPCIAPCAAGADVTTTNVLAQLNTPARANGFRVEYVALDTAGGGSVRYSVAVDGISLLVTYTMPGLTASSGCATVAPYSPSVAATCAILKHSGGAASRIAVKGTVYAPMAAVDLSATGQLNALTQRGIVARTLYLGAAPGGGYAGPLISMPGPSDRQVLLTASVGGVPKLRADVTYVDGLGATPGSAVQVTSWSVLR